jgi:DNA polymerase-1
MQGTAADIIKRAMISVHDWLITERPGARMIMQVHDELVFEVADAEVAAVTAKVTELMNGAAKLDVALKVDVGTGSNWDEAH